MTDILIKELLMRAIKQTASMPVNKDAYIKLYNGEIIPWDIYANSQIAPFISYLHAFVNVANLTDEIVEDEFTDYLADSNDIELVNFEGDKLI